MNHSTAISHNQPDQTISNSVEQDISISASVTERLNKLGRVVQDISIPSGVVSNASQCKSADCINTDTLNDNHKVFNIINRLHNYRASDKIHYVNFILSVRLAYYQLSNVISTLRDRGVGKGDRAGIGRGVPTTPINPCNFYTRLMIGGAGCLGLI